MKESSITIKLAAVFYGVVIILSVLISVEPDEFTTTKLLWGGATTGLAAMLTYFFKEIVHHEADQRKILRPKQIVDELEHSLPVLVFPLMSITIGVVGIEFGFPANGLIDGIFYLGMFLITGTAFLVTVQSTRNFVAAIFRAMFWLAICVVLLIVKKLA